MVSIQFSHVLALAVPKSDRFIPGGNKRELSTGNLTGSRNPFKAEASIKKKPQVPQGVLNSADVLFPKINNNFADLNCCNHAGGKAESLHLISLKKNKLAERPK